METTPRRRPTASAAVLALTAAGALLAAPTAAYAGTTTYDFRCTPPEQYHDHFPPFDAEVTVELTGPATAAPGATVALQATATLDPPQRAPGIVNLVGGLRAAPSPGPWTSRAPRAGPPSSPPPGPPPTGSAAATSSNCGRSPATSPSPGPGRSTSPPATW